MRIYFTPASISYLAQFILAFAIAVYFFNRLLRRKEGDRTLNYFIGFLFLTSLFSALLFVDAVFLTGLHFLAYFANPVLGFALFCLLLFAYQFPQSFRSKQWEARAAATISLAYALYETYYAGYRIVILATQGMVDYRPPWADYVLAVLFMWIPVTFLHQCVRADERPISWLKKIWKPNGTAALAARDLVLTAAIPLTLGVVNILRGDSLVSTTVLNIFLSFGILIGLWLFTIIYVNSQPIFTSFLAKLSGTSITLLLCILSSIGWATLPGQLTEYHPNLTAPQSLRFTPNALGGYDIAEIPFSFEKNVGEQLPVTSRGQGRNQKLDFNFPFYGKTYTELYVTSVGLIRMGEPLYHPNLQYRYGQFPGIFALLIDLEPDSSGGVFTRIASDRLIVTWKELPALQQPDDLYTFQAILYRDGHFDLNYQSLPAHLVFQSDTTPSSNIWLRGITPGTPGTVALTGNLSEPAQTGPNGILQDFNISFREFMNRITLPLGWLLIAATILLFVTLPILLNSSIVKPLIGLLNGVKKMEDGDLNITIPVGHLDEIGILTRAFNDLTTWIKTLVTGLEERVAERTVELKASNEQLRHEMSLREASQSQLIEQQRSLATLDERERLSRELHDGLAQVMNAIHAQSQAAQTLLANQQIESAVTSIETVSRLSLQASGNIRSFILDLRSQSDSQADFMKCLENQLREYQSQSGIQASLSLPNSYSLPRWNQAADEQILHIIQEALTNAHKHAKAHRVEIIFSADARSTQITIQDDGIGFDSRKMDADERPRFGLRIMEERVKILGGRLEVRSAPGKGTKILAFLPHLTSDEMPRQLTPTKLEDQRILLVDDSPIFLEGLRNLLTARGLTVVGTAHDGLDAQEQARLLRPDLVVMDVLMPRCNGIEATRVIKTEFPEIKIVMLTTSEKEEHLFDAIKLGASGFLLKGTDAVEFCAALDKMARGETILSPNIAARIITEFSRTESQPLRDADQQNISERQRQILDLVAGGMTYKEVGIQLHLSEKTIKYHMGQLLEQLHLKNREQAVAYARRARPGSANFNGS